MDRLETVAPDIAESVKLANNVNAREAAMAAAGFAVERSGLKDVRVAEAMNAIRHGMYGLNSFRLAVENVASELDDRHWKLQENDGSATEQLEVFSQARAAATVYFSGDEDPKLAASEAIYEAAAALDDIDDLRKLVLSMLT